MNWYVIETAPKAERLARDELTRAGVSVYLPERKIERFNKKRRIRIVSTLCVFPRYLFVTGQRIDWRTVRECRGVKDVLPGVPHEPLRLTAKEAADVLKLRQAQEAMLLDDTDEARRHRGETVRNTLKAMRKRLRDKRVRVTDGPFKGFVGSVEVVHTIQRLTVALKLFGRYTPVELEVGQFEELAA